VRVLQAVALQQRAGVAHEEALAQHARPRSSTLRLVRRVGNLRTRKVQRRQGLLKQRLQATGGV